MGGLGWVLVLASWVGLCWVHKLMGWVGLCEEKWTHVHLWRTQLNSTQLNHSCPWVGLTHGLGWVGLVDIFQFLVGWVGSTIAKVLQGLD